MTNECTIWNVKLMSKYHLWIWNRPYTMEHNSKKIWKLNTEKILWPKLIEMERKILWPKIIRVPEITPKYFFGLFWKSYGGTKGLVLRAKWKTSEHQGTARLGRHTEHPAMVVEEQALAWQQLQFLHVFRANSAKFLHRSIEVVQRLHSDGTGTGGIVEHCTLVVRPDDRMRCGKWALQKKI